MIEPKNIRSLFNLEQKGMKIVGEREPAKFQLVGLKDFTAIKLWNCSFTSSSSSFEIDTIGMKRAIVQQRAKARLYWTNAETTLAPIFFFFKERMFKTVVHRLLLKTSKSPLFFDHWFPNLLPSLFDKVRFFWESCV